MLRLIYRRLLPLPILNCAGRRSPVKKNNKRVGNAPLPRVGGGDFGVGDRFGTFGTMGFGVGQLFSAKYFPPEAKAKIQELVANLMAAYRARMQKLDWMDDKTKEQALQKLDTYTIKVGYPDHTRDYSKLVVRKDDLIGNVRRAAE